MYAGVVHWEVTVGMAACGKQTLDNTVRHPSELTCVQCKYLYMQFHGKATNAPTPAQTVPPANRPTATDASWKSKEEFYFLVEPLQDLHAATRELPGLHGYTAKLEAAVTAMVGVFSKALVKSDERVSTLKTDNANSALLISDLRVKIKLLETEVAELATKHSEDLVSRDAEIARLKKSLSKFLPIRL